ACFPADANSTRARSRSASPATCCLNRISSSSSCVRRQSRIFCKGNRKEVIGRPWEPSAPELREQPGAHPTARPDPPGAQEFPPKRTWIYGLGGETPSARGEAGCCDRERDWNRSHRLPTESDLRNRGTPKAPRAACASPLFDRASRW